ncbi:replicative DNA helicase [Sphaerisporangium sp. NBC_01403]|uniref:replicative DNA helicase n=1 Tax=Sphaerisporangium sp. NBC_01403 TaxID=2903599 RepID=UPI00324367B1
MSTDTIGVPGWTPGADVLAAEQAVVGAVIQSRGMCDTAGDVVRPQDFHVPAHRVIYAAALDLAENGNPVDPAAVMGVLAASGDLQRVGGGPNLHTLMQWAVVGPAVTYHARIVAADASRRRLHEAGQRIQHLASGAGFDPELDPESARKMLDDALADARGGGEAPSAADLVLQVLDDLESPDAELAGVPTGYRDLDSMLPGLRPGQLIVVGARPKVGKSTVGVDIARHVGVRLQQPALLMSLEMSRTEVMHRLIAAEGRVDLHKLQKRVLTADDWPRISTATNRIAESKLVIDDSPECGLAHIRARLRGMRRTGGCDLVVVDYLQLLKGGRAENRQQQVAELSRGLKLMAREFEVPVVVLAQLNRGSEHRQDRRPVPSDLRESGAVEQDADVVLLLHREDMNDPDSKRVGELDLIVAMQRQGPTGTVVLGWQGHYGRCTDLAPKQWSPTGGHR